jgi:hypothetical protein
MTRELYNQLQKTGKYFGLGILIRVREIRCVYRAAFVKAS